MRQTTATARSPRPSPVIACREMRPLGHGRMCRSRRVCPSTSPVFANVEARGSRRRCRSAMGLGDGSAVAGTIPGHAGDAVLRQPKQSWCLGWVGGVGVVQHAAGRCLGLMQGGMGYGLPGQHRPDRPAGMERFVGRVPVWHLSELAEPERSAAAPPHRHPGRDYSDPLPSRLRCRCFEPSGALSDA